MLSHTSEAAVREGFVYVITHPRIDGVKIGRAFNPEERLKGYQTGCSRREYQLFGSVYFEDAHLAEREVHARLEVDRLEGEWFDVTPAYAMQVIRKLRSEI